MKLTGGIEVHGASTEMERILKAREAFILKYAAEKKWDVEKLTMEQIFEIRAQEGWKNP